MSWSCSRRSSGRPRPRWPNTLPAGVKLPIAAWGNGACRADGTWFENILTEWASHGFLGIAAGHPTTVWNSGLLSDTQNYLLRRLHAPIAYFIGGPSDIANENAMDDWRRLPAGLPAFMGNLDLGHFGTYDQPNGGEFGRVGSTG